MANETPASKVAYAADRLICSQPTDRDRAIAGLLNYAAATWDQQQAPMREHLQAVARYAVAALDGIEQ